MKRVIVDYKKLTEELLSLLTTTYPHGYGDRHIIKFDHKNEHIEALEVRTEDTIYLVKVSSSLANRMANFNLEGEGYTSEQIPMPDAPSLPD